MLRLHMQTDGKVQTSCKMQNEDCWLKWNSNVIRKHNSLCLDGEVNRIFFVLLSSQQG